MLHNFTVAFNTQNNPEIQYLQVSAKCLEDAQIEVYELNEDAIILDNDIDFNPAFFESESDTIQSALIERSKK